MTTKKISGKLNHYDELYITLHQEDKLSQVYKISDAYSHFSSILNILYKKDKRAIKFHIPKYEFDIVDELIIKKIIKYLEKNEIISKENKLELEIDWDSSSQTLHYYINNKIYTSISPLDILQKRLPFINFSQDYFTEFSGKEAYEVLQVLAA